MNILVHWRRKGEINKKTNEQRDRNAPAGAPGHQTRRGFSEDRAAFGFDSSRLGPVRLLGTPMHPGGEALRHLNETRTQPEAAPQSAAPSIIRSDCGPNGVFVFF